LERRPIETRTLSFDQFNASGSRHPATANTSDEVRATHLAYVPIAGKYMGQRSPYACQMIRFLGHMPAFDDSDPAAQLLTLRGIAANLPDPSQAWLNDAGSGLIEATRQ